MDLFHFSSVGRYHFVDWAGVLMMFASSYALGLKKRSGWVFSLLSNLCWIAFSLMVGSVADFLANVVCFGINLRGFFRWSEHESHAKTCSFPSPVTIGFVLS